MGRVKVSTLDPIGHGQVLQRPPRAVALWTKEPQPTVRWWLWAGLGLTACAYALGRVLG